MTRNRTVETSANVATSSWEGDVPPDAFERSNEQLGGRRPTRRVRTEQWAAGRETSHPTRSNGAMSSWEGDVPPDSFERSNEQLGGRRPTRRVRTIEIVLPKLLSRNLPTRLASSTPLIGRRPLIETFFHRASFVCNSFRTALRAAPCMAMLREVAIDGLMNQCSPLYGDVERSRYRLVCDPASRCDGAAWCGNCPDCHRLITWFAKNLLPFLRKITSPL